MDTSTPYRDMPKASAAARLKIRRGEITGSTSGLAPGYVQGNLVILPRDYADEFLLFCQRNPKPCPILGVSDVGNPKMPALGEDFDLATDAPRYCVYRDGELVDQPTDVSHLWRDDLVGFVLGCSFSFEEALIADGLRIKHMEQGTKVPMYLTSIETNPAGRFHGKMVVSMRPFPPDQAIRAIQITTRFPTVHGAPVHIGLPELIGVTDITKPDFGESVPVAENELPVFWACGVTPQAVIRNARPPLCITHAPGCMVVTDLKNTALAVL